MFYDCGVIMTYYCVSSTYKAGGKVYREQYEVNSPNKPNDCEHEFPYSVIIKKYFSTQKEANKYYVDKDPYFVIG